MPAIAFDYPDDIAAVREALSGFVRRVVIPTHERHADLLENSRRRYDERGRTTPEVWKIMSEVRQQAAEAGFYAMCVPEALGGGGLGHLAYFAGWERIFHLCGARYWLAQVLLSHWARGPSAVMAKLQPALREALLPDLMAGRTTICFGLSEPGAGSDATMIKTRAEKDGDGWRLNGEKIWITNGPYADYAIVFAVTSPERAAQRKGGISAFFVPTGSPGFQVESLIKMWGAAGADEAQLRFEDVRIEPHQLMGELDRGFEIAMSGVSLGRIYNAARGIGVGRWALEMGVDYAKVRQSFGKPIAEHQGVAFSLAEAAMGLHAAHLVARNAAALLDRGLRAQKELSMAKAMAVEAGARAVDRVMQAHGAMGFTNEMQLTNAYVALRKAHVADGTSEILRRTIARSLFDGDVEV
ncbi:MAG: hypothetical protein JWQ97_463 [Phenylobacterium sp.]|nr:hypothetical protein [Phenylobacterium sp.]